MTETGQTTVAALQYCAAGTSRETLPVLMPMIAEAAASGAGIVSLPEAATFLAASRRALEDEAEDEAGSPTLDALRACAAGHGIDLHVGSMFLRRADGRLVNRAVMIGADGAVRAQYDKIHMFDANVGDGKRYRESDHFAAGDRMVMAEAAGWQMGLSICYDLRFPHLYRQLGLAGADMIMVPAAFTYPSGRAHWHVLLRARAIETGCFIVAAAQCGMHADGRRTYGHALIISPWGKVLAEAPTDDENPLAGANDGIALATLDRSLVTKSRDAIPSLTTNPDFSQQV
ncbi:MAG: carbon-nitrogen hydrolase family protein [Candidatus Puniceispirillaceae bacterium]